jgi:hypothetical protein
MDSTHVVLYVVSFGRKPASQNSVSPRISESHEVIHVRRHIGSLAHNIEEIIQNRLFERRDRDAGPIVINYQVMPRGRWLLHGVPRFYWPASVAERGENLKPCSRQGSTSVVPTLMLDSLIIDARDGSEAAAIKYREL